MDGQQGFQCPNCAKLWERIERLEVEKSEVEKKNSKADREWSLQLMLSASLLTLLLVGMVIRLLV